MFPRSVRAVYLLICVSCVVAGLPTSAAGAKEVSLRGKSWVITFDPATLAATGRTASSVELSLASPRPRAARVADLHSDDRQARWSLPEENLTVTARLDGDVLDVQFRATAAGMLTWPLVDGREAGAPQAYILRAGGSSSAGGNG